MHASAWLVADITDVGVYKFVRIGEGGGAEDIGGSRRYLIPFMLTARPNGNRPQRDSVRLC